MAKDKKPKSNKLLTGSRLLKAADLGLFWSYVGAVIAVYILDAIFFGSLVKFGALTFVFILIGLVFRTGAVTAGIVLQKLKGHNNIKLARRMIRGLWIFCVVVCLASAINFFAAGHAHKAKEAIVGGAVAETSIASKGERIDAIQDEIDAAKTEMDESIAEVNQSIDAILDDGVPGVSASDNQSLMTLRAEIKTYREEFKALKAEKEKAISDIRAEKETALVDEAVADNTADTWQVFIWLGENIKIANSDGWSTWGLFVFAMLLEAIAAFGLGAYVEIHHFFRKAISELEIDEDVRAIHHDAELTSARIRAEALRRKLAREAEAEANALMMEDPELAAAVAGLDWLTGLTAPPPDEATAVEPEPAVVEQDDPPAEMPPKNPKEDWTSQQFTGAKGGDANRFYEEMKDASKLRIGPEPFSGAEEFGKAAE